MSATSPPSVTEDFYSRVQCVFTKYIATFRTKMETPTHMRLLPIWSNKEHHHSTIVDEQRTLVPPYLHKASKPSRHYISRPSALGEYIQTSQTLHTSQTLQSSQTLQPPKRSMSNSKVTHPSAGLWQGTCPVCKNQPGVGSACCLLSRTGSQHLSAGSTSTKTDGTATRGQNGLWQGTCRLCRNWPGAECVACKM
ncbi:hypothetical protein M011DRAFT_529784 [Sporormia fimetaria CBS 119925]|uniref:Uncharacterized protein n=1 Tax=Sporormia fimetaria CBS 119925 TaxID=1340428 RepID=A0A6A6UWM8_9PLEO|nr:hypothetical protein M011DRAFT_529784 [Sporormia fimetaria CBS 119925]